MNNEPPAYATTRRTWIMFCVTFGVLHGCAVTSMVYASSLQGKDLSSASLGAFFAAYTTAALFVATDVVRSAEINQCVRPALRYYLLFWPPRRSARVLGVLARGVLGLLTRTFDFRTGELHALPRVLDRPDDQRLQHPPGLLHELRQ